MKAVIAIIALHWINTSGSVLERGEVDENDVAAAADNSSPRFDDKAPRSAPAPRKSACCHSKKFKDYRGDLNVTVSGRKCQRWVDDNPHKMSDHIRNVIQRVDTPLVFNYCRNPTEGKTAWCYTQDPGKRWEYCDAKYCDDKNCCLTKQCKKYRGNRNATASGKLCQNWSHDYPHKRSSLVKELSSSAILHSWTMARFYGWLGVTQKILLRDGNIVTFSCVKKAARETVIHTGQPQAKKTRKYQHDV